MTTTAETEVKQTIAVTGIFENPDAVERAYEVAVAHGYEIGDVNVVMSEETRHRYYSQPGEINTEIAKKSAEGGELGGPTGGRIAIALSIAAAVGVDVHRAPCARRTQPSHACWGVVLDPAGSPSRGALHTR